MKFPKDQLKWIIICPNEISVETDGSATFTNGSGSICVVIPFGRKHHYHRILSSNCPSEASPTRVGKSHPIPPRQIYMKHRILSSNCPSEAPPAIVGKAALFFFRAPDFSGVFFRFSRSIFLFLLDPGIPGVRSMGPSVCN